MSSFHGFIGQQSIIKHLTTQLHGAQALNQPCPHILLLGPSGMGKTRLAKALVQEAGTNIKVVHGEAKPKELCEVLLQMESGDFLLLDEAHDLPRDSQEALYEVIDTRRMSNKLALKNKKGVKPSNLDKDGKLIIAPVTFMVATNQPSGLLEALHRRMEITVHLASYNYDELSTIASTEASKEGLLFSPWALQWVARAAQGQPRRIVQLVKGMKRLYYQERNKQLEPRDVVRYLRSTGKDSRGLDREQQVYMLRLGRLGRASIQTLSSFLGLEPEYVMDKIESGLVRLDLVNKGAGGRTLTVQGDTWIRDRQERKEAKKKKGAEEKGNKDENS